MLSVELQTQKMVFTSNSRTLYVLSVTLQWNDKKKHELLFLAQNHIFLLNLLLEEYYTQVYTCTTGGIFINEQKKVLFKNKTKT